MPVRLSAAVDLSRGDVRREEAFKSSLGSFCECPP